MKKIKNNAQAHLQDARNILRQNMVECIKIERLHLYNRGMPCGAKKVVESLEKSGIENLPSVSFVSKVLRDNFLTNGRVGYYKEDYC